MVSFPAGAEELERSCSHGRPAVRSPERCPQLRCFLNGIVPCLGRGCTMEGHQVCAAILWVVISSGDRLSSVLPLEQSEKSINLGASNLIKPVSRKQS